MESWKEKKERKGIDMFETVMTGNFPKLILDTKPQIQKAQRTPTMINIFKNPQKNPTKTTSHTPRHIIFKLQKIKDNNKYPKRSQRQKVTLTIEKQRYKSC